MSVCTLFANCSTFFEDYLPIFNKVFTLEKLVNCVPESSASLFLLHWIFYFFEISSWGSFRPIFLDLFHFLENFYDKSEINSSDLRACFCTWKKSIIFKNLVCFSEKFAKTTLPNLR